jgi:hypothetical protein
MFHAPLVAPPCYVGKLLRGARNLHDPGPLSDAQITSVLEVANDGEADLGRLAQRGFRHDRRSIAAECEERADENHD